MINFCTLFDSNYLARGLALYESLNKVSKQFHLYVIAFDDAAFQYLQLAKLPHLTPIKLQDFEDEQLLKIKSQRTVAEYCWTCTPSTILYCLKHFSLPSCVYIDADMIFYSDPAILLDELHEDSVMISPHRYSKEYNVSKTHGIYCVQFVYFKNNTEGLTALTWWRERCLEWCYAHQEDGKFGDQKYLDDWPERFKGVHVIQHAGAGLAPWNLQQFEIVSDKDQLRIKERKSNQILPVVFFHFHGLKFYSDKMFSCTGTLYEVEFDYKEKIFFPYVKKLLSIESLLKKAGIPFNPNGARQPSPAKWKVFMQFAEERMLLLIKGRISLLPLKNFIFRKHDHFYQNQIIN